MTQEEKDLLLRDLCARSPYGVKFILSGGNINNIYTMKGVDLIVTDEGIWDYGVTTKTTEPIEINFIKPYLRPMSSMTEEEKKEFHHLASLQRNYLGDGNFYTHYQMIDWLDKNMFDYRGLIPMGLALKAKPGMYNN